MIRKLVITSVCVFFCDSAYSFSIPEPLSGENQTIAVLGSTVKIKGLTSQWNTAWVNGRQMFIQKDGTYYEEVIVPTGETTINIDIKEPDGNVGRYSKPILVKENQWFLTGIADSTMNFVEASENFNLRRNNKSFDDGNHLNGKVAYYFAGKIKGKYLIKSSLDTDKATQEKLFTNIDPDKYYPIYGDNSTVVYDVNSQGKFYLLVEWDKSGFTIGNYQTGLSDDSSKLAAYNRTLYGAKAHLETTQKTIYGDPKSQGTFFLAEANQFKGQSEFRATGGSLYYLRHRNIVEGGEQVRLEVRDKNTGMVLRSLPQNQNTDYEIKYDEGRILFRRPVSSVAPSDTVIADSVQEGNDVYVVATYEYKNQDAFPITSDDVDTLTGGVRVSHHFGDHLQVGGTYAQENKDLKDHQLVGVDTTVKIGNFTKISAEIAQTHADASSSFVSYNGGYEFTELSVNNSLKGIAKRVEVHSALGEYFAKSKEFIDFSGYWQDIDKDYSSTDSLFEAGTNKFGGELAHRFGANDTLRLIYSDAALDQSSGALNRVAQNELKHTRVQNFTTLFTHDWQKFTYATEYRMQNNKNSLAEFINGGGDSDLAHIIAEKVEYRLSDRTTLFMSQQLGLTHSKDDISSAGISQKISADLKVYLKGSVGQDGNSVAAGLERQEDAAHSSFVMVTAAHTAMDGRTSTTSFGSNSQISENASMRREKQFVVSDTRGSYTADLSGYKNRVTPELDIDATYEQREEVLDSNLEGSTPKNALSTTVTYNKVDRLKVSSKFEYRVDSGDSWQSLFDSQAELKLTQDWFFFSEYEYSLNRDITRGIALSHIDKKQAGIAFRPVDYDWFNWLFKYTHLQDDRPRDVTSADGGFLTLKSDANEYATEFALDLPWHFQWVEKIAYRDEHLIAVDTNNVIETPQNLEAYLLVHRLNYHLTKSWDVAAEFRMLRLDGSDVNSTEYGPLCELTYQIHKNIAIGAGYNFTSFKDDFTELNKKRAEGFFVRLQGKY